MIAKYYDKNFQSKALKWWRTLSINEQKEFEKKLPIIGDVARHSEIAEIYNYVKPDCTPKAVNKDDVGSMGSGQIKYCPKCGFGVYSCKHDGVAK